MAVDNTLQENLRLFRDFFKTLGFKLAMIRK